MLSDALQICLFLWVTWKVLKFAVKRKIRMSREMKGKNYKKRISLFGKVWILISRKLHSSLDGMLRRQSVKLREMKAEMKTRQNESPVKQSGVDAQQDSKKVIEFKKYQSKVVR